MIHIKVIYIDTLFAVNLIVNYFLLLGCAKIRGLHARRRRLWLSAALGAVYAVICALPPMAWLSNAVVTLAVGLLMLLAAYGARHMTEYRQFLRTALVFFALAMCAAGAVTAFSLLGGGTTIGPVNLRVLVIAFGVCYLFTTLVFRRAGRTEARMADVCITLGEKSVTLRALVDTGNSLTDPLSGSRVCVVCVRDVLPIVPDAVRGRFEDAVKSGSPEALLSLNRVPIQAKFRLIPYSAVGVSAGMLLGFRPTIITVDGKRRDDLVVAISPNEVADNITYSALI